MPEATPEPVPAILWLTPAQHALVSPIVARLGLRVTHAGAPESGPAADLAAAFSAQPFIDLRAAVAAAREGLVLLAAPSDFGLRAAEDAQVLRDARARGVRVASFEPLPASLLELAGAGIDPRQATTGQPLAEWARFLPRSRDAGPVREVLELLETFGPVRSMTVEVLGAPHEGSLAARLFDALDLALAFLGEPETVDASFHAARAGQPIHAEPGETLRGLHGELTAHLRAPAGTGRSALVLAGDQAGRFDRRLTLVGPGGRLRVFSDGFEWLSVDGDRVDQSRHRSAGPRRAAADTAPDASPATALIADQLAAFLASGAGAGGAGGGGGGPLDAAQVLGVAQAALLSARTGAGESPATIRRATGV